MEKESEYESYEEQLRNPQWEEKRELIIKRDNHRCKMCGKYGPSLSVHHRYYLYKHKAWEYNDEVLVTLCRKCHEFIHEKYCPVVYFPKDEHLIPLDFTRCGRCDGRGFLPEYRHVMDGICFKCNGAKYLELRVPISGKIEDYYKKYDECYCYDMINNYYSDEELEKIFQEAKSYQKGLKGYSINESKAVELYTNAAMHGYCKAQNNLGLYYYNKGDKERGLHWLTYAAIQGHEKSINNLRRLK